MAKQKVFNVFDELAKLADEARINLAEEYPTAPTPELKVDPKKGNEYLGKGTDALNKTFYKARNTAQKEIDAGNYDPFFPVEQRYHVDPTNYPLEGNTLIDTLPKKAATLEKNQARLDTQAGRDALNRAFDAKAGDPAFANWYAMGQLEEEFVKTFGEELGRKMFKERFADAMAATTGGMSPEMNLMAAQYGNFLKERGLRFPEASYEIQSPVRGGSIATNAAMYNKIINDEVGLSAAQQPKRYNFSANFMGHQGPATIDEQMTKGMTQSIAGGPLKAPPPSGGGYSIMENIVAEEAAKRGLQGSNMQDVAWAGFKNMEVPMPMIKVVNEAIERTARILNMKPAEVFENYKKGMPLYGATGIAMANYDDIMGAMSSMGQDREAR